jgi:hypothetical protein
MKKLICKSLVALCLMYQPLHADCITPQQAKTRVLEKYAGSKFVTVTSKLPLAFKLTGQNDFKDSDTLYAVEIPTFFSKYVISGFKNGCYKTMGFVNKKDFPIQ